MIIFENEAFWLLNKPSGIAINDEANACGLVSAFREQLGVEHAHPVHRLDKATSGLFLIAKTKQSNRELSLAFAKRAVEKYYLAVVRPKQGAKPKKKMGWVKGDMQASRNGSWMLLKSQENPAITHFQSWSMGERRRLCLLKPATGKTHQLRVAMKALSCPIVGDQRYGGDSAERLYLHAYSLAFELAGDEFNFTLWPEQDALFAKAKALGLDRDVENSPL